MAKMRVAAVLVLLASVVLAQNDRTVTGSPNDRPERDRYLALDVDPIPDFHPTQKLHSAKAMIAGVTNPFAVHEGLETLKRGGSAADAALTTALAQIALNAGAAMSYAGILTAVYYDANSGKVYSLNAGWNTPQNETEPLSIPRPGTASGRTALVPGFMAGVQALHERFGRRRLRNYLNPQYGLRTAGSLFLPGSRLGVVMRRRRLPAWKTPVASFRRKMASTTIRVTSSVNLNWLRR